MFCKRCDAYTLFTECQCELYGIYHNEQDEDETIYAIDFDNAAGNYAKYYNEHDSDYRLMNESLEIVVSKDGVKKNYTVSAEPDVFYSVLEK